MKMHLGGLLGAQTLQIRHRRSVEVQIGVGIPKLASLRLAGAIDAYSPPGPDCLENQFLNGKRDLLNCQKIKISY